MSNPTNDTRAMDAKLHEWLGLLQRGDYNLEVVHAMELALAPELREDYARELDDIVNPDGGPAINYGCIYALITATAAQRARALVAVLERVRGEVGT